MAEVCGLALVEGDPDPMHASSLGVGQVLTAALDSGAERILLGIGGSASTDGGAGVLRGLGARILDADGVELPDGGAALVHAAVLDLSGLHPGLRRAKVQVACDVDNPLTGPAGAAAVYGPQKGASPDQVAELDAALTSWAELVATALGRDVRDAAGAGAAGGVGFARDRLLEARPAPGRRAGARADRARVRRSTVSTWWSPARARWTSRPCTARPPRRWPPLRPRAACRWPRSRAAACSTTSGCGRPASRRSFVLADRARDPTRP